MEHACCNCAGARHVYVTLREVTMRDLVARLRELAEALEGCEWEVPLCAAKDCVKAADELERLTDLKRTCECSEDEQCLFAREGDKARGKIERMQVQLIDQLQIQLAEDYLASKAEIERLHGEGTMAKHTLSRLELERLADAKRIDELQAEIGLLRAANEVLEVTLAECMLERDECRRLLREAVAKLDWPELANHWGGWCISAKAAGGE